MTSGERISLVPASCEPLRSYSPRTARICLDQVEHRGVVFPPGTIVAVCAERANRQGEDGESFDITAPREGRLLTFGAGTHYCLGANLARAELEEALAFLAPRTPGLALDGPPQLGGVEEAAHHRTPPIRRARRERRPDQGPQPPVLFPAEVQDVGVDVLGQRPAGHTEELSDLAAGKRGLPRPQEELPGLVVEHDIGQWRLGQPALLADLGELLMVAIGREVSCRVIERRQVKFGHKVHNKYDGTPLQHVVK